MKNLQDILNGLTSDRRAEIEDRTEALRQTLIEGKESSSDSPLDMDEIRREARKEAGLR